MYIDAGEVIRMRVEADEFYDDEPGPVQKPEINGPVKAASTGENKRPPYTIIVSDFGLDLRDVHRGVGAPPRRATVLCEMR